MPSSEPPTTGRPARHGSISVAAGILASRLAGFVRLRVFAHYFGLESDAADAFNAANRIPNLLQNLFGEGALSASFIPVYAPLVRRRDAEADRVAAAVGTLLALCVSLLVVLGLIIAPWLVAVVAPGFEGDKRELTVLLVRILFPGAGALAMAAWCMGVLGSHHRFLLSYAAPVLWNSAMIGTLIVFGPTTPLPRLTVLLAWGSVAGAALQLLVQLPHTLRLAGQIRPALHLASDRVRSVIRNFVPALFSRGVVQISSYIDAMIASLLPTGAITGLSNAQLLYTLPVSLFGISVAAAELPAMAGDAAAAPPDGVRLASASHAALRERLQSGLRRIAFFVVPSAVAFLALGDVISAAILQTGRFRYEDAVYVWGILAGSAVGLLASTLGRLYSSTYFALHDTRTPFRGALLRVISATIVGFVFAIPLPRALGIPMRWGATGLTAASGLAAWMELIMLRRGIHRRLGATGLPLRYGVTLWGSAAAAAAIAWLVKLSLPPLHPILVGIAVLASYAAGYAALTLVSRVPEATRLVGWRR